MARIKGQSDALVSYLASIVKSTPLSRDEETELSGRVKRGDTEARDRLIEANLRFVVDVALDYKNRGLPIEDLISAGNFGLMTAAERFDGTKGFKFISYAVWWIKQAIFQTLAEQAHTVRIPLNQIASLTKVSKARQRFADKGEIPPSIGDLVAEEGILEGGLMEALNARHVVSLDAPVIGEKVKPGTDGHILSEIVSDPDAVTDKETLAHSASENISKLLKVLDRREKEIVKRYFGLDGSEPMTLDEIGVDIGITRERVRQLKERALSKLKRGGARRVLEGLRSDHEPEEVLIMADAQHAETLQGALALCMHKCWRSVEEAVKAATGVSSLSQLAEVGWERLSQSMSGCDQGTRDRVRLILSINKAIRTRPGSTLVEARQGLVRIAKHCDDIINREVYFAPHIVRLFNQCMKDVGGDVHVALGVITTNQDLLCELAENLLLFEAHGSGMMTRDLDLRVLSGKATTTTTATTTTIPTEEREGDMAAVTEWGQETKSEHLNRLWAAFPPAGEEGILKFEQAVREAGGNTYTVCKKVNVTAASILVWLRKLLESRGKVKLEFTQQQIWCKTSRDRAKAKRQAQLALKAQGGAHVPPVGGADGVAPDDGDKGGGVHQPPMTPPQPDGADRPTVRRAPEEEPAASEAVVVHDVHQGGDDLSMAMIAMLSQISGTTSMMGLSVDQATKASILMAPLSMLVREFCTLRLLGPAERAIEMIDQDARLRMSIKRNPDYSSILGFVRAIVKARRGLDGAGTQEKVGE